MNMMHRFDSAMKRMGNTHTLQDILDEIGTGCMQSFAEGDTWVITQVVSFPRRTILEVFIYVGNVFDLDSIYARVLEYAKSVGATQIRAFGRPGWRKHAEARGWRKTAEIYCKDI